MNWLIVKFNIMDHYFFFKHNGRTYRSYLFPYKNASKLIRNNPTYRPIKYLESEVFITNEIDPLDFDAYISCTCPICFRESRVEMFAEDCSALTDPEDINVLVPYLEKSHRRILRFGYCLKCQYTIYPHDYNRKKQLIEPFW